MSTERPVLLVVDDDPAILRLVGSNARPVGFEVVTAGGGRDGLAQLGELKADLVLVDLQMPDVDGLEVVRAVRDMDPHCQTVLMTGHATIDTAVEAIKLGARDYLTKPLDLDRLRELLDSVREEIERRQSVLQMEGELAKRLEFCGMIGRSPAMQEVFGLIRRLAPHVRTALITGETGTGKELVAAALHQLGPRRTRRFVPINCSAVVESLFESELFGHMRGAFTGATASKPGLFEAADGGTLFLDEVGELPLPLQAKLLRVLETGEVQRVGSLEARRVDVQVIAATNRDLLAETQAGRYRSDLFYRLNIIAVQLPPLRDRREDIPYLTAAFVREFGQRLQKRLVGLTPAAEQMLVSAPWDGNVRELRNLERACILAPGDFVTERELASSMPRPLSASRGAGGGPAASHNTNRGTDGLASGLPPPNVAREDIARALQQAGGNKAAAARLLGISRRTFYRRLERFGLASTPANPGTDLTDV